MSLYVLINMYWLKWLQFFTTDKDTVMSKNLIVQAHISRSDAAKIEGFKRKIPIFV